MKSGSAARRSLVARYLVACGVAIVIAWLLSRVGLWLQMHHWHPAYKLVPVNHVSLYFFPLAIMACVAIAGAARCITPTLVAAGALVWPWVIGRVVFWRGVAVELTQRPEGFAAIVSERQLVSVAIGAVGLAAIAMFGAGVLTTLTRQTAIEWLREHPLPPKAGGP